MKPEGFRIREMPWVEMCKVLRVVGPEIGRLAKRGDRFALKVYERYVRAAHNPTDAKANRELRVAFEDYMARDLRIRERLDLGSRFGHLLEEKPRGPRIVVPGLKH